MLRGYLFGDHLSFFHAKHLNFLSLLVRLLVQWVYFSPVLQEPPAWWFSAYETCLAALETIFFLIGGDTDPVPQEHARCVCTHQHKDQGSLSPTVLLGHGGSGNALCEQSFWPLHGLLLNKPTVARYSLPKHRSSGLWGARYRIFTVILKSIFPPAIDSIP